METEEQAQDDQPGDFELVSLGSWGWWCRYGAVRVDSTRVLWSMLGEGFVMATRKQISRKKA